MSSSYIVLLICCLSSNYSVLASPKKYESDEGGFKPNVRYYESNLPSYNKANLTSKIDKIDKESRFGLPITTYGHSGSGVSNYPSSGVGYPMKIDIGGIAIGALIGLGAVLIIPKIAHLFSGGYGGYRSLEDEMSTVTDLLARVDNSLEQHNIDSSSCMQRIICSYVHEAQKNMQSGDANTLDQIVYSLTNNSLFGYMLDGSAMKQAVDMGKSGDLEKCASLYMKCPVSKDNITQIISSLLPAK